MMAARPHLRVAFAVLALTMVWVACAQPKVSGRISGGFQAPTSTDGQGRRHLLMGSTAEPRGKDLYELTDPRVTSYDAQDAPEMFIAAPRCFYDMNQNFAWSDTSLSVRTADGKFAIEGAGWRWDPEAANLVISNDVVALVQKAALATNSSAKAQPDPTTNPPVRITAASFLQEGETASFIGNVLVRDGTDTLRCDRLNLQFLKSGGVEVIEAVGGFELTQAAAAVRSGRAIYNLKENIIRITEKPRWESGGRSGFADLFIFNRTEGIVHAEGNVFMKLPLTNFTEAATASDLEGTNRFLQVYSDKFRFEEATSNRLASAYYDGAVRALYTEANISADSINVRFDATNRVQQIVANHNVVIESRGNKAFGRRAVYELIEDKIVLSGDPRWELERATGHSDTLIFFPRTKEVLALNNVEMILPGQSVGGMFGVNVRTNPATGTTPMVIRAQSFSRGTNIAVFHHNVVAADVRGQISCETMTLGIGASNNVQRILVEDSVRIEQQGFTATGQRGDYDAATGLVHLTGDPVLFGEDRTLRATAFIIDRNANTFSVAPGRYRIEMKMKEGARPVSLSPIQR